MTKQQKQLEKFESDILDLIRDSDEFTTSDLQAAVSSIVRKIVDFGIKEQASNSVKVTILK